MKKLTNSELKIFENLFQMKSEGVLDFNNNDMRQHILSTTQIDVYNDEYIKNVEEFMGGSSKAKILKYFWHTEDYQIIIKLLNELVNYTEVLIDDEFFEVNEKHLNKAKIILKEHERKNYLIENGTVEEIIDNLIDDINQSIIEGKPEFTLDRLHVLIINFIKELCDKHEIDYEKNDKLNQLFRKYIKFMDDTLESDMSKTILMYSGSIFDKFNEVRNNKSYAHDNKILNRAESLLIYRNIVNVYEFIKTIEKEII